MNSISKLLVILCLAVSSLQLSLAAPSESNPIITQMLEVSGLSRAVQTIPDLMRSAVRELPQTQSLPPEQRMRLESTLVRAYAPSSILEELIRTLQQNYDEASFRQYIQLFQQPLTRKIHSLEDEAETPQGQVHMQDYFVNRSLHSPIPERLALLQQLDHVTHDSFANTQLQIIIARTMAGVAVLSQPPELRPDPEQFRVYFADLTEQLRANVAPAVTIRTQQSYLYAYRDVSNAELRQYIKSYDNPAIQLSLTLIEKGLQTAFEKASASVVLYDSEIQAGDPESKI